MKNFKFIAIISLLFFSQVVVQTLDEYITIAAENNPGLKAKHSQYKAALEKASQMGSLSDPEISFGIFTPPMERYTGDQVAQISLMQMFPWFGTLSAGKKEAALMAKSEFEKYNEAKSMLFYEIKAAWYALYRLKKEIDITKENVEILNTLEQIANSRYETGGQRGGGGAQEKSGMKADAQGGLSTSGSGTGGMNMQSQPGTANSPSGGAMASMGEADNMGGSGSMVDVLKIQVEVNELKYKLTLLEDSRVSLLARFNRLVNRDSAEPVQLPDTLSAQNLNVASAELPDSILNGNPMVKMLSFEEAAFIAKEKMSRRMSFPMIGLGLQYDIFKPRMGGEGMMNGEDMIMPMASVSIPLWRKKYRASVSEAQYMRQTAIDQREDLKNQLMADHEEALKNFRDAERRSALYNKQTLLTQQSLNVLMVQYTTSGSNFEEVLRMQEQLLGYRLKKIDAIIDGNMAIAMLHRLMGR
jgi:outer membrane protein TolC